MQYGLYGLNQYALTVPEALAAVARAAEEAGFDSVWVGEHVVLPDPLTPPPYMAPEDPILDPIAALSFVAAFTHTIKLATGVIILPQRNPLVLAKELASVDVISGGRLVFGLGVGYLEKEMVSIGVPLVHRGTRSDEYLAAILALWMQPHPSFHGKYVTFDGIQAYPRPLQKPHPPLVIGGRSPSAHRRAVRHGNGWYGYNLSWEETSQQIASLTEAAKKYPRDPQLGPLEISVTPRTEVNRDEVQHFADIGVHRLILRLPHSNSREILKFVHSCGKKIIDP